MPTPPRLLGSASEGRVVARATSIAEEIASLDTGGDEAVEAPLERAVVASADMFEQSASPSESSRALEQMLPVPLQTRVFRLAAATALFILYTTMAMFRWVAEMTKTPTLVSQALARLRIEWSRAVDGAARRPTRP